jgi:RHS repeat-associated protein
VANEIAQFPQLGSNANGINVPCNIGYSTPRLAHRYVSFDGNDVAQQQDFTYTTTWSSAGSTGFFSPGGWTSKVTTVLTTDNVVGKNFQTIYTYVPVGPANQIGDGPEIPVEQSVQYFDWGNTTTPIKTVTKTWGSIFTLTCEVTTENGLSTGHVYQYAGLDQLADDKQYDYSTATPASICNAPSGAARETKTTYQSFLSAATPYNPSGAEPGGLFYKPTTAVTYDGSGNRVAETDYSYDQSSLAPMSGIVHHDDTNFGTSNTARGNATTVTKLCLGCTSATTTYTYDITGQPASMTDPCGNTSCSSDMPGATSHTTNYSFADNWAGTGSSGQTNAYLTTITYPKTGSTVHQEGFQYNYTFGDLTKFTDENNQITSYQYEVGVLDRLTQSAFPDGGVTNIAYDDSPSYPSVATCQLITGSAGAACSATSPPSGWKTSAVLMDGMFHTKQTQLVSDPDGADYVDISYDGLGRKETVSNPHRTGSSSTDGTATTTYDGLGRPILVTEQDGSTVQTLYDQTCNTNTNALGATVVDESGHERTSCTDGLGRLVEVDEPAVSATSTPGQGTVTVGAGNLSCTSNGHGGWIPTSGSLSITVNGVEETTGYGGTCNGSIQTMMPTPDGIAQALASLLTSSSAGVIAEDIGNATIEITATTDGSNTNYPLSVTPTSGPVSLSASGSTLTGGTGGSTSTPFVTLYYYDALGNLLCVEQHGGVPSSYGCSSAKSNDINSQWRIRRFSYDSLSRLLTAENPETGGLAGQIFYTYDANSNLASKTAFSPNQPTTGTPVSVVTSYTYDALNRLTGKSYADSYSGNTGLTSPVAYGYDGVAPTGCPSKAPPALTDTYKIGRRTSMCDGSGGTSWLHDPMGRVQQERRTIGAAVGLYVKYTFNKDGSLSTLQTPPQKVITYTVLGAGRAVSAVDSGDNVNFVTNATYAPPGELQTLTNGGVIYGALSYNSRLQPTQMFYGTNTPPAIGQMTSACPSTVGNVMNKTYNFSFGAGDNGNVISIANCRDATRSQNFTYDVLNRIETGQSSGTQWGETYTIDPWGNLTNRGGISGKTYSEPLSAAPATPGNQLTGYGYDAAGNLTTNASTTYVYDDENRLVWTSQYRYIYDADGNRVEKCQATNATAACPTSGTTGTLYWRGTGSDTLDESDLAGNPEEEYIFFNGNRISRRDVSSTGATIAVHYYFSDQVGSHSVVENATGTACEQDIDYYPYGGVENDYCTTPGAQHYKFNGKERDTESMLDNFGARYDTSNLGRFMTPDWAEKPTAVPYAHYGNPQSLNLYSYVENNPTTVGDPDGHEDGPGVLEPPSIVEETIVAAEEGAEEGAEVGTAAEPGGGTAAGAIIGGVIAGGAVVGTYEYKKHFGDPGPPPAPPTPKPPAAVPSPQMEEHTKGARPSTAEKLLRLRHDLGAVWKPPVPPVFPGKWAIGDKENSCCSWLLMG